MNQVIFNFHDVILLMTALLCCFFALLLVLTNNHKNISNYFLAAFLLAHAFIPLHELILWGAEFKFRIQETLPDAYFVAGFAYFLDGALLYFYVKSLVFEDFQLRRKDLLHLSPLLLFILFMLFAFYSLPSSVRLDLIINEIFVYGSGYISVDFVCKLMRVAYCAACLHLIIKYRDILKSTHSNIEKIDIFWLRLLVIGFLVVTIMEALLSLSKVIAVITHYDFQHYDLRIFELIGLSGYYALFVLICLLVFSSMRYFSTMESVPHKEKHIKKDTPEKLLNPEFAALIDSTMRNQKLYMQPDITLDLLAEKLDIPSRDLSMTINRHFQSNFYEFINGYRIEESKSLLADPKRKHKTITDIYLEVGFNSKSVFNTFFKKNVGVTPSQYRNELKESIQ